MVRNLNPWIFKSPPGGRASREIQVLLGLCAPLTLALPACSPACEGLTVGSSTAAPVVALDWPYGTGTANGVWSLTLSPSASGTSCVELEPGAPPEAYHYTLELADEGTGIVAQVLLLGVPFATGSYADEDAAYGLEDTLIYASGERVESDRAAGAVHYRIEGQAVLEANNRAGALTWTGYERIVVLESDDPEIRVGCTYHYDVTGTKVCDE